jgi:hypothetical protein
MQARSVLEKRGGSAQQRVQLQTKKDQHGTLAALAKALGKTGINKAQAAVSLSVNAGRAAGFYAPALLEPELAERVHNGRFIPAARGQGTCQLAPVLDGRLQVCL